VRKALTYEIDRQTEIRKGPTVTRETRLWNENRDVTEDARQEIDYRYFPSRTCRPSARMRIS
jgi:aspartyl-tRNA(Asn)/glutamyl-tRNA(Gln) amidotransferase subunit B